MFRLILLVSILTAGCSDSGVNENEADVPLISLDTESLLVNVDWNLTAIIFDDDRLVPTPERAIFRLQFDTIERPGEVLHRYVATLNCQEFSATYSLDNDVLVINPPPVFTLIPCSDEFGVFEFNQQRIIDNSYQSIPLMVNINAPKLELMLTSNEILLFSRTDQ